MGETRTSELQKEKVKCSVFYSPAMPLFFIFFHLGQSCCGPWCRVPGAQQWKSNMDHLTPVKTALLVERQALSAYRVKCYAASPFTPSFPQDLSLSLTQANSPDVSLPFHFCIPSLIYLSFLSSITVLHFLLCLLCPNVLYQFIVIFTCCRSSVTTLKFC